MGCAGLPEWDGLPPGWPKASAITNPGRGTSYMVYMDKFNTIDSRWRNAQDQINVHLKRSV
jgi:hypothetical protein